MTKKLMATVLAASLAMTSISATPALAKPSDGVRILQGLAALYIISRVIDKNNDQPRTEVTSTGRHERPQGHRTRDHRNSVDLPRRCLKTFHTGRGETRAYGARCVRNNAPYLSLPRQCKRQISTDRGRRTVFTKRCLREHGYNVARR